MSCSLSYFTFIIFRYFTCFIKCYDYIGSLLPILFIFFDKRLKHNYFRCLIIISADCKITDITVSRLIPRRSICSSACCEKMKFIFLVRKLFPRMAEVQPVFQKSKQIHKNFLFCTSFAL